MGGNYRDGGYVTHKATRVNASNWMDTPGGGWAFLGTAKDCRGSLGVLGFWDQGAYIRSYRVFMVLRVGV